MILKVVLGCEGHLTQTTLYTVTLLVRQMSRELSKIVDPPRTDVAPEEEDVRVIFLDVPVQIVRPSFDDASGTLHKPLLFVAITSLVAFAGESAGVGACTLGSLITGYPRQNVKLAEDKCLLPYEEGGSVFSVRLSSKETSSKTSSLPKAIPPNAICPNWGLSKGLFSIETFTKELSSKNSLSGMFCTCCICTHCGIGGHGSVGGV